MKTVRIKIKFPNEKPIEYTRQIVSMAEAWRSAWASIRLVSRQEGMPVSFSVSIKVVLNAE